VIWSLALKLSRLPSAVAVLFPCCGQRVLEVVGVIGDSLRVTDDGSSATSEEAPTSVGREESIAAALLAHAQRVASAPIN
jgi:hypothetical protein